MQIQHPTQGKLLRLAVKHDLSQMSLRQIGRMIGVDGSQNVKHHIDQLKKRGLLGVDLKIQRKVGNLKKRKLKGPSLAAIPIFGSVNCGEALEFADNQLRGFLRISPSMVGGNRRNLIALHAVGDSMNTAKVKNEKNIEDGDYVIVDVSKRTPKTGDYIVSIIDDSANVKKFVRDKRNDQILLLSESTEDIPPICIAEDDFSYYSVAGEVVQVVKTMTSK